MKRAMLLLGALSAIALSAYANTVDFDNDPGSGYRYYFPGGANKQVLDDVGRATDLAIKQINIAFFNENTSAVDATVYVYAADPVSGGVGTLLGTFTVTGIPNGLTPLQIATGPGFAAGYQNLWIGLSTNAAQAGMVISPNPYPNPGSSANVFAWDDDGNGVIDNNDYWNFGGNPVANFAIETYVPEPASMVALSAGLAGLVGLRRRKARTA